MAVLPPTEKSTCASRVVGICTKSTPALEDRRGETGQIADHPAAERDHRVAAVQLQRQQLVAQALQSGEALGLLARRNDDGVAGSRPASSAPISRGLCSPLTISSMTMAARGRRSNGPISSAAWSTRPRPIITR